MLIVVSHCYITGSIASSTGSFDSVDSPPSFGLMQPPPSAGVANTNNSSRSVTSSRSSAISGQCASVVLLGEGGEVVGIADNRASSLSEMNNVTRSHPVWWLLHRLKSNAVSVGINFLTTTAAVNNCMVVLQHVVTKQLVSSITVSYVWPSKLFIVSPAVGGSVSFDKSLI